MDWVTLFYVLFVFGFANTGLGGLKVHGFLTAHPAIRDERDLAAFKQMARLQMHLALAQIGFLGGAGLVGLYAMTKGLLGLLPFLVFNGALVGVSLLIKRSEDKARSLPVSEPVLRGEYESVCRSWTGRAMPDF